MLLLQGLPLTFNKTRTLFLATLLFLRVQPTWAAPEEKGDEKFVEQTFLTEAGALKSVFPNADKINAETRSFTPEERKQIESRLGWVVQESTVTVHRGFSHGNPLGYAIITEEIGKFKPITFIVKAGMDGKVDQVEVMVYREAVGAEVKRQRFARQFRGKSATDPLRINRDILNITGATMSVQAITAGVKKVLVILDELYFKK